MQSNSYSPKGLAFLFGALFGRRSSFGTEASFGHRSFLRRSPHRTRPLARPALSGSAATHPDVGRCKGFSIRLPLTLWVVSFLITSLTGQGQARPAYDVQELFDVSYLTVGDMAMQLDLFLPQGIQRPVPVIICLHGGAWWKGTRKNFHHVARALAQRGYATASVSYRLSGVAPFPAQIQDVQAAVVWLKEHAEAYGFDRHRVGATGHSAGGHLAALLATAGNSRDLWEDLSSGAFDARIHACVPMGAQTDLETERIKRISPERAFYSQFLSGTQEENHHTYRQASPLAHLDISDPPMAFIAGELDDASTRAATMRARLDELGIDADLLMFPEAPHNFLRDEQWFVQSIDFMDQFFAKHLLGD